MDLSIVIPIFNEEGSLPSLFHQIKEVLKVSQKNNLKWECLLVDDGSQDSSWSKMLELAAGDNRFKFIKFRRNFGQTAALAAGIRGSSGDWVATLDGDMQNDPSDILPLYQKATIEGWDVVSGWRKNRKDSFLRSQVSKIANRLVSKISGLELHDYGCSMKIYRRSVLDKLKLYGEMHRFLPIYASLKGAKVCEMAVNHRPREQGVSKYGYLRIVRVLVDMLLFNFLFRSGKPFQFFVKIGVIALLIGLATLIAVLVSPPTIKLLIFWSLFGLLAIQIAAWMVLFGLIVELILRTHYLAQQETQYEIIALKHLSSHPDLNLAGPVATRRNDSLQNNSEFLPNDEILN